MSTTKALRRSDRMRREVAEMFDIITAAPEILDVLIEAREGAIGEQDEVARCLRKRCQAVLKRVKGREK